MWKTIRNGNPRPQASDDELSNIRRKTKTEHRIWFIPNIDSDLVDPDLNSKFWKIPSKLEIFCNGNDFLFIFPADVDYVLLNAQ